MVLNPNGIEPTFLKLDSWSPGAGFIPIINFNVLNWETKTEFKKKNQFYAYKKHLTQFFKKVVQFHAYRIFDLLIIYIYIERWVGMTLEAMQTN
jgi:hypothetical protein